MATRKPVTDPTPPEVAEPPALPPPTATAAGDRIAARAARVAAARERTRPTVEDVEPVELEPEP